MNRAFLALGSNIQPEICLPASVRALARHGSVIATSRVFLTAPIGFKDQPDFLNAALLLATDHSASELCERIIPDIESALGRVRDPGNRNAPRTIDIDLALFNHEQLRVGHREIPDPEILERSFLAAALADLDPEYVHPVAERSLAQISEELLRCGETMRIRKDVVL